MGNKVPSETKEAIIQAIQEDPTRPYYDIAREFGVSGTTVSSLDPTVSRRPTSTAPTKEARRQIERDLKGDSGITRKAIAHKYNVGKHHIAAIAQELGVGRKRKYGRNLTPELKQEIIQLLEDKTGLSFEQISEKYGCSPSRVGQIAKDIGLGRPRNRRLTVEQVKAMRKAYYTNTVALSCVALDYPEIGDATIRDAVVGSTYKDVPMPPEATLEKRAKISRRTMVARDTMELINAAILYATGLFSKHQIAAYMDIPAGTLDQMFHKLPEEGWYIPSYGGQRKGLPDFANMDILDMLIKTRKKREKIKKRKKSKKNN